MNQVENVTLLDSASRTASGQGVGQQVLGDRAVAFLDVTAASGTTPALDVDVEEQDPVSGKWFVVASFAQKTAVGTERLPLPQLSGSQVRANFTIGGTTPDFTFSIGVVAKSPR